MDIARLAKLLQQTANAGGVVYYSDLVEQFGLPPLDGAWNGHPLEQAFATLDREDADRGRPFRTSVVISKNANRPGDGYFKALSEMKGIHAKSEVQKIEVHLAQLAAAKIQEW